MNNSGKGGSHIITLRMKKHLSCIIGIGLALVSMVSCSSSSSVAEKALKLVGVGTFVPDAVDRYLGGENLAYMSLFTDYDDIFDSALIRNAEAEDFLKCGVYREVAWKSYFNFSSVMFSDYKLISKEDFKYVLHGIRDYSKYDGLTKEAIESIKKDDSYVHEEYQEKGDIATWVEAKDVPACFLKYNLDNKHIATIIVLNLPDEGWRVCGFTID